METMGSVFIYNVQRQVHMVSSGRMQHQIAFSHFLYPTTKKGKAGNVSIIHQAAKHPSHPPVSRRGGSLYPIVRAASLPQPAYQGPEGPGDA